uniref:Transient receptor potential cation channel subfamily M member 4 n=1 Tax=Oryzias latipes TaxID=8090 RepID=A0A3P9HQ68_ORYLA
MKESDRDREGVDGRAGSAGDQSWISKVIKKRVCTTFIADASSNGRVCQCGSTLEGHDPVAAANVSGAADALQWDSLQHSSEQPTDAFGEVEFPGAGCRHSLFLRLSCDTPAQIVYALLTNHWGLPAPNLVVSVVGGEGHQTIKPWVRDILRNGLVKAAVTTGSWILTGGLREGVSRCVGEAVRDLGAGALNSSKNKVIAVGVAPWGMVNNRQQLVNPKGSFPARYYVQHKSLDSNYLDNNCKAFLLVDDGSVGRRGGVEAFRADLEDYISHQRTGIWGSGGIEIPVLCMLIAGDACMLQRVNKSLEKSTPWLVLAGSGSAADLISEVLSSLSDIIHDPTTPSPEGKTPEVLSDDSRQMVRQKVRKYFPAETEVEKLVEHVLSIYQKRDFITVFRGESEDSDDFDTVLLRSILGASKRVCNKAIEWVEELKLAVAWNRVDIAKAELFNGAIAWSYHELEESMTDALVNDKPHFVRLFCENGLNILDYLTYGRLEKLYNKLSDTTLAYSLLQKRLSERQDLNRSESLVNGAASATKASSESLMMSPASELQLSLYEVSRLLWDLLGDVCQPFYYGALDLDPKTSPRVALKQVHKLLLRDCEYRRQRCRSPWTALFIWAVLQNRPKMAVFFWEMAGESVMSALAGCKILRELSKLEDETESKLEMKKLAQKFEDLAHDVFGNCYQNSETLAFTLLIRKSPVWGKATCLQMATAADARLFFSQDGVQFLLSQIWWGDMERNTEVWKLILTFFLPPLLCTRLIQFREEEELNPEAFQGMDTDGMDGNEGSVLSLVDVVQNKEDAEELRALKENPFDAPKPRVKRPFAVQRCRQFWFAPVTSFLGNVLMYFLFLGLFAYVLLVDFKPPPPDGPSPLEIVLYFWVFTLVCEEIRQSFFVDGLFLLQKMKNYIQDVWNKCDLTAIILFILGVCCRMFPASYYFGRGVMAVDFLVFTLRLIHIFAVHKQLGPKIIIVGKMVKDVFFFMFFLAVWLLAYGVANQALLYSYDPRSTWIFRRVFYRPYMHIFGQIPIHEMDADKLDFLSCTNDTAAIEAGAEPCIDTYANWLVVLLLVVYLLFTNIVLVNMLIAMFSHTFSKVQEHSDTYWKFQRFNLIVEYQSRPSLPPPFIIISHINLFIKRYIRRIPSVKSQDFAVELRGKKVGQLNVWEAAQKETLLTAQSKSERESDSARLKRTSTKVDSVLKQIAEMRGHDRRLQLLETQLEYCCSSLSWMMEALSQSNMISASRPAPLLKDHTLLSKR